MKTTEILQKVLTILNISAAQLAVEIGANVCRINDILSGRTKKITPKTADLICKRFPNISYTYLTLGLGSPYADGAHVDPYVEAPSLTPSQVLSTLLQYYSINSNNLAMLTGISRGTLSNLISGNNRPRSISKQNADRIIAIFPDVSLQWLVNGKGPMFRNGENAPKFNCLQGEGSVTDVEITEKEETDKTPVTLEDVKKLIEEASNATDAKYADKLDAILDAIRHIDNNAVTGFAAEDIHPSKD